MTQLFQHTALPTDAGLGELQRAEKQQQGEGTLKKMLYEYLLHPFPFALPQSMSSFRFSIKKANERNCNSES